MKKDLSEIVFIIDRSGSMVGLEKDTIEGYNSFLKEQKSLEGEANVSTIMFNHDVQTIHDRVAIGKVNPITLEDYNPDGTTALYDAIGLTIDCLGKVLNETKKEELPSKIIFVIITDGMENASHLYSHSVIKKMIEHQKTNYSWEFIFLGANFDAEAFAQSINIDIDNAATYNYSGEGVRHNFSAMNYRISAFRTNNDKVPLNWKKKIKKDKV